MSPTASIVCVIAAARRPRVPRTRPCPARGRSGCSTSMTEPLPGGRRRCRSTGTAKPRSTRAWRSRMGVARRRGARIGRRVVRCPDRDPADEVVHDLHDRRARARARAPAAGADRALVKRVANHQEWGVRVVLDRTLRARAAPPIRKRRTAASAARLRYLTQKKAQRDAAVELASRARDTVAGLFDRLAARSAMPSAAPRASCPSRADRCCSTRRFSCRGRARPVQGAGGARARGSRGRATR